MKTAAMLMFLLVACGLHAQEKQETIEDRLQKVEDKYQDCRDAAQDRYETKLDILGTMNVTPLMRAAYSKRIRDIFRFESKACRDTYQSELKALKASEAKEEKKPS